MTNLKSARLYGYLRFNIIKLEATNMNLMVGIIKGYQLYLEYEVDMMKLLSKSLLFASLLAVGSGAAVSTNTVKADSYYGLTGIGSSVVTIRNIGAEIYDVNGNPTGRYLPQGSQWKSSEENDLASGTYYGVGANEFVKAGVVGITSQSSGASVSGQYATKYDGVQVTQYYSAETYDMNGNPTGRYLPEGSDWKVDAQLNLASGTYYRVATNEYVPAVSVRPYQNTITVPENKDITVRSGAPAPIYDQNGQLVASRALGPNTTWYTDEYCDIGHIGYYKVATNEYVRVIDVLG